MVRRQQCTILPTGKISLSIQIQQEGMRVLAVEVRESQVPQALPLLCCLSLVLYDVSQPFIKHTLPAMTLVLRRRSCVSMRPARELNQVVITTISHDCGCINVSQAFIACPVGLLQAEREPHLLPFWRPLRNVQADTWELLSFRLGQPFDMRITSSSGKQVLIRSGSSLSARSARHSCPG